MGERRGAQVEEARALRGDELGDAVALLALELRALVAEGARLAQHLAQPREPRVLASPLAAAAATIGGAIGTGIRPRAAAVAAAAATASGVRAA